MKLSITGLDYLVILFYIAGIFFLAFKSGKLAHKSSDSNLMQDQYLAGKSLTFIESLCSIIATEVSALTFLGIPAFAYSQDFSFVQVYFGAVLGRIVIARLILPLIYDQGLTIYEAMAHDKGTLGGRRLVSIFYSLNKLFSIGVRLFSGSILVAEFFNLSIYFAVGIICLLTFFYTLIGGLKAVVRTDIIQMSLFVTGGFVAHYIIPDVAGVPWIELMENAYTAGKMSFINFDSPTPFITGIIGGFLFDIATHGVDQDFAQRLTGNKSQKTAQLAIISSTALSISIAFLFLSIGALLWSHYQINIAPAGVNSDKLFAYFITNHFPTGLKGLMVAGVLAATMSTLDSTINALSSCLYNDILPKRDIKKLKFYYRIDILTITLALMLVAFIASKSDGLLLLGLKIASWTGGPLLGLFFAVLVWKKWTKVNLTAPIVLIGYVFGLSAVALNTFIIEGSWHFNVYFGFISAILATSFYSRLIKNYTPRT